MARSLLFNVLFFVTTTLFVVIDLLQTLDRYIRIKPPLIHVLEHFVYRVPAALHDGLPVVMLVATIFLGVPETTVTRLRRNPVETFATVDRFDGPAFAP